MTEALADRSKRRPDVQGLLAGRIPELVVVAALAVWSAIPFIALFQARGSAGGVFTGAVGSDAYNQFQYEAWIRDAGNHVLSSNLFGMEPAHHDFLQPMYLLSGLLLHTGLDIQWVYLLWRPVAIVVVVFAVAAYARRWFPDSAPQRIAALVLAVFYFTPALRLATELDKYDAWGGVDLLIGARDMSITRATWGTDHTAIAIALMPVFLLGLERLLARAGEDPRGAIFSRTALLTGGAGMLASWLHPAQGATLLLILIGLAILSPPWRRHVALLVPAVATLAPLLYLKILTWTDPSWELAAKSAEYPLLPALPLLLTVAPLAVFSLLGLRLPRSDAERMLLLWPLAAAAVYFVNKQFPPHALGGLSIPLAILAVRGWSRITRPLRLPAVAGVVGLVLLAIAVVQPNPIKQLKLVAQLGQPLYRLTDEQHDAMRFLEDAPDGGVLARPELSMSVPAFTGHPVWAGHGKWTPNSAGRDAESNAFFDGGVRQAEARSFLAGTGVRYVLADCKAHKDLASDLTPVTRAVHRFGCVRVYEVGPA